MWPLQFPEPKEEARKRGEALQCLPTDERIRQILDTIETGMILIRESKDRPAIDRLFLEREREWQSIQRELFLRHGR